MDLPDLATSTEQIRRVLYQYARGKDRMDWGLVKECYHDDATDDHGVYVGNLDGFLEMQPTRHAQIYMSMHFLGNMLIEIDGATAATETYCHCVQWYQADSAQYLLDLFGDAASIGENDRITPIRCSMWVRYLDRFEYREGPGWRIATRKVLFESLWAEQTPQGDPKITRHSPGRSIDDPSFVLFQSPPSQMQG